MWMVHMLAPFRYYEDLFKNYGSHLLNYAFPLERYVSKKPFERFERFFMDEWITMDNRKEKKEGKRDARWTTITIAIAHHNGQYQTITTATAHQNRASPVAPTSACLHLLYPFLNVLILGKEP
jgi:hypothetical protein